MASPNHRNMTVEIKIRNHNKCKWLKPLKDIDSRILFLKLNSALCYLQETPLKNDRILKIKLESLIEKIQFTDKF